VDLSLLKRRSEFEWTIEPRGKMRVPGVLFASESLVRDVRRASTSDRSVARPDAASLSRSPVSKAHTARRSVRPSRTDSTMPATAAFATNTPTAPESRRIQSTCSADDVS
jgi:hypothetical protein